MSIIDNLIGILVPHSCLACGVEGRLLCATCTAGLTDVEPICPHCQRPSLAGYKCLDCISPISRVQAVTVYEGSAKALIWQLKLNGSQAAGKIMARLMAELINDYDGRWLVVPVPTATGRSRQRGYDQAKLLAREIARKTRFPYLDCLARQGQTHQHGANRHDRLQQLENSFRLKSPKLIRAKRILLVDDVVTTGATLEAAAQIVMQAGAKQVEALAFARPN